MFSVSVHEFVNAPCGIDEFHLSGVERMGGVRYFQFVQGIGFSVDVDGFFGGNGGTGDEYVFVRHVFERYDAIVRRMYAFFHFSIISNLLITKFQFQGAKIGVLCLSANYFCGFISISSFVESFDRRFLFNFAPDYE
jgi:hypothetical protein